MRKLEFQKLEIKFGNRKFEELFKCGILEINKIIITKIIMIKRINTEIGILEIRNQNFEELFKDGILKNK